MVKSRRILSSHEQASVTTMRSCKPARLGSKGLSAQHEPPTWLVGSLGNPPAGAFLLGQALEEWPGQRSRDQESVRTKEEHAASGALLNWRGYGRAFDGCPVSPRCGHGEVGPRVFSTAASTREG